MESTKRRGRLKAPAKFRRAVWDAKAQVRSGEYAPAFARLAYELGKGETREEARIALLIVWSVFRQRMKLMQRPERMRVFLSDIDKMPDWEIAWKLETVPPVVQERAGRLDTRDERKALYRKYIEILHGTAMPFMLRCSQEGVVELLEETSRLAIDRYTISANVTNWLEQAPAIAGPVAITAYGRDRTNESARNAAPE